MVKLADVSASRKDLEVESAPGSVSATRLNEMTTNATALLDQLPDIVFLLDVDGRVVAAHGRDRLRCFPKVAVGDRLIDHLPTIARERFREAIARAAPERREDRFDYEPASSLGLCVFEMRITYAVERWIVVIRDLTSERRRERQASLTHRMESVGRLAGGIAHDFNNLLTAIVAHGEFARGDAKVGSRSREHVDKVLCAASRAAELTRKLLAFSHRHVVDAELLDAREIARAASRSTTDWKCSRATVSLRVSDAPCPIRSNAKLLRNVVDQLVRNACEACDPGDRITITVRPVELGPIVAARSMELSVGPYVQIVVHDTGTGMTEDVRSRIFDPFFTTKVGGMGTGLSLALCYGAVRQAGGAFLTYSRPNRGTTVAMYLPRVDDAPKPGRAPSLSSPSSSRRRILLVEDDPAVRDVTFRALDHFGYHVVAAENGHAALAMVEHAQPIDAVVTDIVMPRLDGRALAGRLRARDPELSVLFMSGYTHAALEPRDLEAPNTAFLQKPFTPQQLADVLDELLARRAPRRAL